MLNRKIFHFVVLFILIVSANVFSQTTNFNVFELNFLYEDNKFEQIIVQTRNILKNKNSLNKNQLIETHKYRALSFYNLGEADSSRLNFYTLLSLDKDCKLDPVKTSPKILAFFDEIKNNFSLELQQKTIIPYNTYIFVEDIRPYAALRSVAMPGWGQHYKNQTTKGYIINGAFGATVIGSLISYAKEKSLRDDYLKVSDPNKVKRLYKDYNNMSKIRRVLEYSAITIWAFSVFDALYTDYIPVEMTAEEYLTISLNITF